MNDPQIRALLRARLAGAMPGALLVDELGILQGTVRADVAAVDDLLHGFEVKAACDSLARLAGQIAGYSRVFDRCTLVTEPPHSRAAIGMLPPWWGVLVAEDGAICEERTAGPNPGVEPRAVAELLWTEDVLALLDARRAARGFRGRPRRLLWARLCEVYTNGEIREHARRVLRERYAGPERKKGWISEAARGAPC